MDCPVCRLKRIDAEIEIACGLILGKRNSIIFIVIQKGGYRLSRIKIGVPHQDIDKLGRDVYHQDTAVFVEDLGIHLLFQDFQGFWPPLSLNPVRKDIIIVLDGGSI